MANRVFAADLLAMLAGAMIWAIHFLIIYGFTAVACAHRFADVEFLGVDVVPLTVALATGLAIIAAAAVLVSSLNQLSSRSPERDAAATLYLMPWLRAAIAGFFLVAILWEGLAAAIIPPCI